MFDLGFLLAIYLVGSGHHSVKALEVAEAYGICAKNIYETAKSMM